MKLSAILSRRLRLINLPGAILMMLLQRTPVVSLIATTEEMVIASPMGTLLKAVVATASALGAVNTMVGATPLVPSTGTASGISVAAGSSVSVFYTVNGTQTPPMSWKITGTVPGGLNFSGLTAAGSVDVGSLHLAGTPTTAGTYNLTLQTFEFTNDGGDASPIYNYTITVTGSNNNTTPSFTTQPASQSVTAGTAVTFTAAASGSPAPTFQWQKDGVNIAGATNTSYSIASASVGDAGSYTVVATNSVGSVISNAATLTVNTVATAPAFTTQPASQSVTAGGAVSFTFAATGAPTPAFQWKKDGANIAGATGTSFSIASAAIGDAGAYTVVASNSAGSVTSNTAILTVHAATSAPIFTTQPAGQFRAAGSSVTLTSIATGLPSPTYQWKKNGVDINGATKDTYSIAKTMVSDTGVYTVVATNSVGSVTSFNAVLTVKVDQGTDFNGDGYSDILWQNKITGERFIWFMTGTAHGGGTSLNTVPTAWSIAATADFDDDGQKDILWQNTTTGERYLWLMSGVGHVSDVSLGLVSTQWSIVAAADFNADGHPDILWQNTVTGERYLWLMIGAGHMADVSLGIVPTAWSIVAAADFNGDGQSDILWQNTLTGERYLWLMAAAGHMADVSLGTVAIQWSIAEVADFNGDGQADILWQNTATGQRYLWLMSGTSHQSDIDLGVVDPDWIIVK